LHVRNICNMKPKNYKKTKQKTQTVEEPTVAYGPSTLENATLEMTSNCEISTDTDTMTVDDFIGKIKKALDQRYENIQC